MFYVAHDQLLDWYYLGFVFCSTLVTYTFQRYMKLHYQEKLHGPRMAWMEKHLILVKITLLLGTCGALFFSLYLSVFSLIVLAVLGIISFFYAYKFNLTNRKTNLREIPGIKIFLIGLVWALSCSVIPSIETGLPYSLISNFALGYLLYIIAITIPFDIRDIDADALHQKTIPQLVGKKGAKAIAIGLLIASYLVMLSPRYFDLGLLIAMLISVAGVLLTKKERNELFFSFFIDGLLILTPVLFYLFQTL